MMYLFLPTRSISRKRGFQLEQAQIVQASQRDDEVEVLVAVGVAVLGAVAKKIRLDVLAGVGEAMLRNVEAQQS